MPKMLIYLWPFCWLAWPVVSRGEPPGGTSATDQREIRAIAGWAVHVSRDLLTADQKQTERALELLTAQLDEVQRVVPPSALADLRKVSLWISPEYPGTP